MLIELPLAVCSEGAVNSGVVHAEYFPDFASEPLTQIVVDISLSKCKPNTLTHGQPSPIAKFPNKGLGLAPVVFSPVEVTVKFRQKKDEVERSGEASDRDADDACSSPRSRFLEVEALLASCTCFCSEIFWVIILATWERTPTMLGSDDFRFAAVRSMAGLCINNRDSAPALPPWGLL